ncbi:MAG: YutD family protein [Bacilli bacterium]|nr:YutD family protein [Bacilli bacterium]
MEKIILNHQEYKIIKNIDSCLNLDELNHLFTDYFYSYDYICGDYSYDKLRLKGFNDETNSGFNNINDISKLNEYLEEYCSYNRKYFLIKKC